MCTISPVSGTECYFECKHGYKLEGGVEQVHCGLDGKWDVGDDPSFKCKGELIWWYKDIIFQKSQIIRHGQLLIEDKVKLLRKIKTTNAWSWRDHGNRTRAGTWL